MRQQGVAAVEHGEFQQQQRQGRDQQVLVLLVELLEADHRQFGLLHLVDCLDDLVEADRLFRRTHVGAPIQIGGEFIKDETGEMVVSKLNEEMLARIADITGGAYVRSSKQSIGLDEIVKAINEMEQTELSTVRFEEFNEQYQYLLIAALVLLLLEFVVLDRRNPLLAHLNIFREK